MLATDRFRLLAALSSLSFCLVSQAMQPNAVALPPGGDDVAGAVSVAEAVTEPPAELMMVGGTDAPPTPYQLQIYSTHPYSAAEISADSELPDSHPDKKFLAEYAAFELTHRCGAVYIGDMWALTAAHCVLGVPGNLFTARRVRGGTVSLLSGGTTFRIERAIVHGKYRGRDNPSDKRNDIALLKLEADASTNPQVVSQLEAARILDVGAGDTALHVPDKLKISGWGVTSPHARGEHRFGLDGEFLHSTSRLKQAEMNFVTRSKCARVSAYADTLGPQMICGGYDAGPRESCDGDSGGPVIHMQASEPLLVGLIVGGLGCGLGKPTLYTYVPFFTDWIARAKDTDPGDFLYVD